MRGLPYLAWRHARFHRGRNALLVGALAVAVLVPVATQLLLDRHDHELRARAASTPLLAGAPGSRFDLTLEALYFRRAARDGVTKGFLDELVAARKGLCVPLHLRHTARGRPLVGTSPEYFEQRRLAPARGSLPLSVGDVVLGARVARELGLGPGDALFSDPVELYDISRPAAMKLHVCGVLAPAGTPDDGAVFADVKTAWTLDGSFHGHGEAEAVAADRPDLVIGSDGGSIALSGALIEENELSPENAASFHFHGDPASLPLSSVLVFPPDHQARTILKARVNARSDAQMVDPSEVVDDLLAVVFRIKVLFDGVSLVLLAATVVLVTLVLVLSVRLRARELRTLDRIGAAPGAVARLVGLEVLGVVGLALALAGVAILLLLRLAPSLMSLY